jgi:hypothetical protein
MDKSRIRVARNTYGNYVGFIGSKAAEQFGEDEFRATQWLSDRLNEGGFVLSAKSDVTMRDVERHRANVA